jgi:hypothetical protein
MLGIHRSIDDASIDKIPSKAVATMTWTVRARDVEGKSAQILIDEQFALHAPVKDLVKLSGFSLFCKLEPTNTLWHPDEGDALDLIEGRLIGLCEKYSQGKSLYVMRLSTFGVREYYIYHAVEAEPDKAYAELRALHPDYRIEFATVSDAHWSEYLRYLAV